MSLSPQELRSYKLLGFHSSGPGCWKAKEAITAVSPPDTSLQQWMQPADCTLWPFPWILLKIHRARSQCPSPHRNRVPHLQGLEPASGLCSTLPKQVWIHCLGPQRWSRAEPGGAEGHFCEQTQMGLLVYHQHWLWQCPTHYRLGYKFHRRNHFGWCLAQ